MSNYFGGFEPQAYISKEKKKSYGNPELLFSENTTHNEDFYTLILPHKYSKTEVVINFQTRGK